MNWRGYAKLSRRVRKPKRIDYELHNRRNSTVYRPALEKGSIRIGFLLLPKQIARFELAKTSGRKGEQKYNRQQADKEF
jgi:hypothetical protein